MGKDIKRTTIYLPERLHAQLVARAKEHKRSLNSEVVWALERYIQKEAKQRDSKNVYIPPLSQQDD